MLNNLLTVKDLQKHYSLRGSRFSRKKQTVKALNGVSFNLNKGETLGIVGESGSGKSTLGLTLLRILNPTSGKIVYDGLDITKLNKKDLKTFRKRAQIVFQNPTSSLDPMYTVKGIIAEPLTKLLGIKGPELEKTINETLKNVGLDQNVRHRHPHALSGGQAQRVSIARSLSVKPEFLVLDEPASALDASVQSKILNLLNKLQQEYKLTYIFISHDIAVVAHMSDRISVMYLGKTVETGSTKEVIAHALHPYSQALISSIPGLETKRRLLKGDPASALNPPQGCSFHPRCQFAQEKCGQSEPLIEKAHHKHYVACHYWQEILESSDHFSL